MLNHNQEIILVFFFPQIFFKTTSGEWQTVMLQDSSPTTTSPTTSTVTTATSPPAATKRTPVGGRKERTLPKIAPAGGMIALNTPQLSSAAQTVQTISINGVQVQGVPVTITNAGGETDNLPIYCWVRAGDTGYKYLDQFCGWSLKVTKLPWKPQDAETRCFQL